MAIFAKKWPYAEIFGAENVRSGGGVGRKKRPAPKTLKSVFKTLAPAFPVVQRGDKAQMRLLHGGHEHPTVHYLVICVT